MCEQQQWTESSLRERLMQFSDTTYSWANLRGKLSPVNEMVKAAVLVPLVINNGQIEVWLTERSQVLRNDGGDVSFPGGKKDHDDVDAVHTCLREAAEEIGLKKHQVRSSRV